MDARCPVTSSLAWVCDHRCTSPPYNTHAGRPLLSQWGFGGGLSLIGVGAGEAGRGHLLSTPKGQLGASPKLTHPRPCLRH